LALSPDIVIVLIGGNNFSDLSKTPGEQIAQFSADLTTIVRRVISSGSKLLLLQYPRPRAEDMSKVWTHLDKGNVVTTGVALAEGVETLELAPAFEEASRRQPLETLLSPVDGVHLQPYGEIVVAHAVASRLQHLAGKAEAEDLPATELRY
jgi:lysophospholipase L1-like esterase